MSAPATIVDWMAGCQPPAFQYVGDMSEPSKTWVDRMWHALLDPDVDEDNFDDIDEMFFAYLDTLDEDDRAVVEGTYVLLDETVRSGAVPRCEKCGGPLCPHCAERYRNHPHDEEAPEA